MPERPILFNAQMVRALLDGRKTQTRRPVKPQPACNAYYAMNGNGDKALHLFGTGINMLHVPVKGDTSDTFVRCPFGVPGDRLWVRETHYRWTGCGCPPSDFNKNRCYSDTPEIELMQQQCCLVTVPSIHMPRWASRITLKVTGVRVERLRELSMDDAFSEGMAGTFPCGDFAKLWNSTYDDKGLGWKDNPWVWVVEFKRE